MQGKRTDESAPSRNYLVRLDAGDTVMASLNSFMRDNNIGSGYFSAIGAFETASLAFFDRERNVYDDLPVTTQTEVLAFTGNLSWFDGAPRVHAHAMLGHADGSVIGGHFFDATVWPTLEVAITAWDERIERALDEPSGIPLPLLTF